MRVRTIILFLILAFRCAGQDTLSVERYIRTGGNDRVFNHPALIVLDTKAKAVQGKNRKNYRINAIHFDYVQNCEVYFFIDDLCGISVGHMLVFRRPDKRIDYVSLRLRSGGYRFDSDF